MKRKNWSFYILLIVLAGPLIFFAFLKLGKYQMIPLPIIGERDVVVVKNEDGSSSTDTVYHTVPAFSFTDQYGNIVTEKNFDSGIYVANFFFASCPDVCPAMNGALSEVAAKFADNPKIKFISHTVDPESDSVPVLAEYAKRFGAKKDHWYFVTGSKRELYDVAQRGYLVSATEGDVKPASFIHSQQLVLVDSKRRIRGMYDGLNQKEVDKLFDDIKTLLIQENVSKPDKKR
jgi:protein SCO1/2